MCSFSCFLCVCYAVVLYTTLCTHHHRPIYRVIMNVLFIAAAAAAIDYTDPWRVLVIIILSSFYHHSIIILSSFYHHSIIILSSFYHHSIIVRVVAGAKGRDIVKQKVKSKAILCKALRSSFEREIAVMRENLNIEFDKNVKIAVESERERVKSLELQKSAYFP